MSLGAYGNKVIWVSYGTNAAASGRTITSADLNAMPLPVSIAQRFYDTLGTVDTAELGQPYTLTIPETGQIVQYVQVYERLFTDGFHPSDLFVTYDNTKNPVGIVKPMIWANHVGINNYQQGEECLKTIRALNPWTF